MSTNPGFERLLERVDPARRDIVRKLLLGAAVYSAPLVVSYSMDSLEGTRTRAVAEPDGRRQRRSRRRPAGR